MPIRHAPSRLGSAWVRRSDGPTSCSRSRRGQASRERKRSVVYRSNMVEPTLPARRTRGGRWGLLATALVASGALVLAGWSSYARVSEASRMLARGQGEALLTRVRTRLASSRDEPTSKDLDGLVDEERSTGLRYVGVARLDGVIVAETGAKAAPIDLGTAVDEVALVELPGAVRIIQRPPGAPGLPPGRPDGLGVPPPRFPGPPPGVERPPPGGPSDRLEGPLADRGPPPFDGPPIDPPPGPDGLALFPPRGGPTPVLIVDFDPVVADAVLAGALRTFVASSGAAVALMAAAIVFWWQLGARERARERLERERRLAALGEMSAVLAHEIRNPLTALKGHAQLLVEQLEPGSRVQKKAERIVGAAVRLEDLSTNLLDFIRSSELARKPVDPKTIIERVVEEHAPGKATLSLAAAPASFSLDPLRFRASGREPGEERARGVAGRRDDRGELARRR